MQHSTITSSRELADLCAQARDDGRIGLDTEFLWERTYAPLICLAQLNVGGQVYVADPLADVDLTPIAELISDPDVSVVMHAPHADLVAFASRFDARPTHTFDTQLAAGFIGLSAGLAYERLVHEVTGKRVQPSESFSDWSRRPLTQKQLRYAGEDVEHLFTLADVITERASQRGRDGWMREELDRRFEGAEHFITDPDQAWRKVGRRGKLNPRDLAVLREIAAWRERLAKARDMPVGWVAKDPTLIELARRAPANSRELSRVRGIDGSLRQRHQAALLEAVERGREAEPISEAAPAPHRGIRRRTTIAKGLATALMRARCETHEIAPELVGTTGNVEELIAWVAAAEPSASTPFLLRGWREPFGSELVALVNGNVQLQLVDHEPYLLVHGLDES